MFLVSTVMAIAAMNLSKLKINSETASFSAALGSLTFTSNRIGFGTKLYEK